MKIISLTNKYIWLILSLLIIIISIYFTINLKGIQFKKRKILKKSLPSLMISLGAKIGVGSISGIALSIYLAGPGVIFWIWIISLITSSITYVETYLGVKYKTNNNTSPSNYIKYGINNTYLASLFSIMTILTHIVGINMIQSNTFIKSIRYINVSNDILFSIIFSLICAFIIYSGTKTITKLSNKLVPIMASAYIIISILIIIINIDKIPLIIFSIFKSALNIQSFNIGFIYTFIIGMQKSIFASETGMGTSAIAASNGKISMQDEGYAQIIGNYFMSFIICTSTALIVLIYNNKEIIIDPNGIEIAINSFNYSLGNIGTILLIIFTILFSISTIISSYFFCEKCLEYFNNIKKHSNYLKYFCIIFVYIGTLCSSTIIWIITDILISLVTFINLYSIFKLRKKIK